MRFLTLLIVFCFLIPLANANEIIRIPILTYHNFDPAKPGSMTISTEKFAAQLKYIKENGYTVIPLSQAVNYLLGKIDTLPKKPVVITADDGRETVYTYMLPLIREYRYPVTLFIYPSAISNAKYALTWNQLHELQQTSLFDIQCHTYWHPNFNDERKNLSSAAYAKLVQVQLVTAKDIINKKLGTHITLLAWPYGVYNPYLEQQAAQAGYAMAFSIDDRSAVQTERAMSMPRYMVAERYSMKTFAKILDGELDKTQRK
jgi:peptidoglycan/xylan/chitin deacetylase (PgdA/CDA1 family)